MLSGTGEDNFRVGSGAGEFFGALDENQDVREFVIEEPEQETGCRLGQEEKPPNRWIVE